MAVDFKAPSPNPIGAYHASLSGFVFWGCRLNMVSLAGLPRCCGWLGMTDPVVNFVSLAVVSRWLVRLGSMCWVPDWWNKWLWLAIAWLVSALLQHVVITVFVLIVLQLPVRTCGFAYLFFVCILWIVYMHVLCAPAGISCPPLGQLCGHVKTLMSCWLLRVLANFVIVWASLKSELLVQLWTSLQFTNWHIKATI